MKFLRKLYSIIIGTLTVKGDINIQANRNAFVGTIDDYALSLRTNNTDRVYITNNGSVGIGTTTPSEKLTVGEQDRVGLNVSGPISQIYLGSKYVDEAYRVIEYDRSTGKLLLKRGLTGQSPVVEMVVASDGSVGIGTVAPLGRLHVVGDAIINGAFSTKVTKITANVTLDNTYHVVLADAQNGAITITLPNASTCAGRQYIIKKIDSTLNAVTVIPLSGQTIDGQSSISITIQNDLKRIISDGTNWYII